MPDRPSRSGWTALAPRAILGGELVALHDISASGILHPSGVAAVRDPRDPTTLRVYVTDRGIDNVDDPDENDDKIYVFEPG